MRTRAEAVQEWSRIIQGDVMAIPDNVQAHNYQQVKEGGRLVWKHSRKKGPYHVGLVEIRHLLDFIYVGPPQSTDEQLKKVGA